MSSLRSSTNYLRSWLKTDVKYHNLSGNGHASGNANGQPRFSTGPALESRGLRSCLSLFQFRRLRVAVLCGITFAPTSTLKSPFKSYADHIGDASRPHYLRLLIPGSRADDNLCKTVISGAVLGYPPPTLINYGQIYENENLIFGGSHLAKIQGVLNHLNALDSSNDDDLVAVVDGYDFWFQLRPSVLIERYFDINRRANERIREQLGSAMDIEGVSQRVVFSAQKRCWPKEADHPACYAVPKSNLPADVYGNETDHDVSDEKNPYVKYRQRYLNSGSCIGPVAAVRAIFERALQKANRDPNIGSDQGIFAEIFGEQEFQRHVIGMKHRTVYRRLADWFGKRFGNDYSYKIVDKDAPPRRVLMGYDEDGNFEFGLGLDYEMLISQATVFSEYDTAWVNYENRSAITEITKEKGIPLPPRVGHLPVEVAVSLPPFQDRRHGKYVGGDLPIEKTWNQVSLFTNMWTGFSPVAVHHNAHRDGLKGRIQTHWNRTWFQPHVRAMLNAHALMPQRQVATTYNSGQEQDWWPPTYWSWNNEWGGVTSDKGEWIDYDNLCSGTWAEIFRDGLGIWHDPRYREPRPPWKEENEPKRLPQVGDTPTQEDDITPEDKLMDALEDAVAKASAAPAALESNTFDTNIRAF